MAGAHVVVVGGGFAGLTAAQALARRGVAVTLIDRRNHHLFQPLLYQVATATLSPAQIAAPIRKVLSRRRSAEVLMGEVTGFDLAGRRVLLSDGECGYDYLVVAAGATHSYFGHDEWAPFAPGLKSLEDAVTIRRRLLLAFERAERAADQGKQQAELTFVIVGGGPTGVELAGAMVEIARNTIPADFRSIDTTTARVILVEAGDRLLGAFPEELSARAKRDLEDLGVEVWLHKRVTQIDEAGVTVGHGADQQRLETHSVVWAAGVAASPIGKALGAPLDKSGRVMVGPDLSIPGHPEVFVLGDMAHVPDGAGGQVPGVAPAAMQMGRFVADVIVRETRGKRAATARPAFAYHNKGNLATIGRARAVAAFPRFNMAGFTAWALWALIHVAFLITFRQKLMVMVDWLWSYVFFERGARLITGEQDGPHGTTPSPQAARRARSGESMSSTPTS